MDSPYLADIETSKNYFIIWHAEWDYCYAPQF